jgi:hypothetical protein
MSLVAKPWRRVPETEKKHGVRQKTIRENPDLFAVTTPIQYEYLRALLEKHGHPNPDFFHSVCDALRDGAWPWVDIPDDYPLTWEARPRMLVEQRHRDFVQQYRDEEIAADRFSRSFGTKLLDGMYCMPIGVVPKPHTGDPPKLRQIDDMSAGKYSINSMIAKENSRIHLDNLHDLGREILSQNQLFPARQRIVYKSDVKGAYRIIPMAPEFQMFQAKRIEGELHLDRANVFGRSDAGHLFTDFNSLPLWIAEKETGNTHYAYMDDNYGVEFADQMSWYEPYQKTYPKAQADLLRLWDRLGIPHEEKKQVYGEVIEIIGFLVDPNAMSISLSEERRQKVVDYIEWFISQSRISVKDCMELTGYLNWTLNVFPLLKPGINPLWDEFRGGRHPHAKIHVNREMKLVLRWFSRWVRKLPGVLMMKSLYWGEEEADVVVYTDASTSKGFGIWFPRQRLAYFSDNPPVTAKSEIYYLESYAIVCALYIVSQWKDTTPSKIWIWTDSTNSAAMFNSLRARGRELNGLLLSAAQIILSSGWQHHVDIIPGKDNVIADALSRFDLDRVRLLEPDATITRYTLPNGIDLGALWE